MRASTHDSKIAKVLAKCLFEQIYLDNGRKGELIGIVRDEHSPDFWDAQVLLDGDDLPDLYSIRRVQVVANDVSPEVFSDLKKYELIWNELSGSTLSNSSMS